MSRHSASDSDTRALARELNALPIGFDLWIEYFVRPNGIVVVVDHSNDDRRIHERHDRKFLMTTLLIGSKPHPELKSLLPTRGATDQDCTACAGTGRLFNGKTYCPECGGIGWLGENGS